MVEPQPNCLPFIVYDKKTGFQMTPESESFLLSLNPERKLGIISIVGKYRTGKSFFINRVLLNKKKGGFNVGSTVNACTKGIWIWNDTISPGEESEYKDMDILVLDTEGFGDTEADTNHDSRIFLFSLLLCSFFIYNSVGNIDENALNGVSLIINLAKNIQVKNSIGVENDDDPANYFPAFLWIVRDFTLQMVDKEGKGFKDKDYLEKALEIQKGLSDSIESKNRLRKLFKHFFKDRDCCTLVRPLEKEEDLRKLNDLENEEFRPEFTKQITILKKKIMKKISPKVLNGKTFNGGMLVELTKAYIKAMNSGSLPNIDNAWQYLVKNESKKAMLTAVEIVEKELSELIKSPNPQDVQSVKNIKSQLQSKLVANFRRKAIGSQDDVQEMLDNMNQDFKSKFKKVKESNLQAWKKKYDEYCSPKILEIESKLKIGTYSSYFEFQNDLNQLKTDFEKNTPEGPNKESYLQEISNNLNNLAAEHISRKSENLLTNETKKLTLRLELTEKELQERKSAWEVEKRELERRVIELEVDNGGKNGMIEELKRGRREGEEERRKMEEYKEKVELKFDHVKQEHEAKLKEFQAIKTNLDEKLKELEKENEILRKNLKHSKDSEKSLEETISGLNKKNNKLEKKMEEISQQKAAEIATIHLEYESKLKEANETKMISSEAKLQINELMMKNSFYESQVKQFEIQLQESKRIYDSLLLIVQSGMDKKESRSSESQDFLLINRNLSQTNESLEQKIKFFEMKNKRLKHYKKIVKSISAFRCKQCSEFFNESFFIEHYKSCSKKRNYPADSYFEPAEEYKKRDSYVSRISDIDNLIKSNKQPSSHGRSSVVTKGSNASHSPVLSISQVQNSKISNSATTNSDVLNSKTSSLTKMDSLKLAIRQTNIQTSQDNKKHYTEYTIFCNSNNYKWRVTKAYQDFCKLYHDIINLFPSFQLNNCEFLTSTHNHKYLLGSDRPSCLDEKRKELESFLNEVASIEFMRNHQIFRKFLNYEKAMLTSLQTESQSKTYQPALFNSDNDNTNKFNIFDKLSKSPVSSNIEKDVTSFSINHSKSRYEQKETESEADSDNDQ